jgi:TatA/E family protein of Tat protein translocase
VALIGGVIVLVFFSRRIPDAMRSLGRGITQFRKGLSDKDTEDGDRQSGKKEALPAPKEGEGAADVDAKKKDGPSESSSG